MQCKIIAVVSFFWKVNHIVPSDECLVIYLRVQPKLSNGTIFNNLQ